MTKPTVYILKSLKDKKFYIGSTINLERRLQEHNDGKVKSTKGRRPFIIVYKEEFKTIIEAKKREYQLKKLKGNRDFKQLINAAVVQW